jgi:predicted metal-dependent enzyme (double-stranded beta helix superfamily)
MRPPTPSTAESPPFARFVAAAERHVDDPPAIAGHLAELLGEDGWLSSHDQRPGGDRYRQHLLYVSPTRRLSVVALVWQPGQRTPIHDHIAWCIVGVYRGVERELRYRLVEHDGAPCLLPIGSVEAHPGHVEALVGPAEDIHCVTAGGDEKTISIHVYGADIERRGTSVHRCFDDLRELDAAV